MKNKTILITISVLAFILRFWRLDAYPALNADEAAIGYNAYSLIETGKDEHGNPWPIHFQSFNDFKPGLYVYLVLPLVKFLGLNEWAVRIPNAFLGVLTVLLIYLLVVELFKHAKSSQLGLTASLFLAISPWHIHFSRGGWEVNTATFFIVSGIVFFLKFVNEKRNKFLLISTLAFVLSLYTYHAARLVAPLVVFGLLGIYYDHFRKNLKHYIVSAVAALIFALPLVVDFTRPEVSSRAAGVGLLADQGPLNKTNEQRGEHYEFNSPFAKVPHNKIVNYSLAFLQNWAEHFHGLFLFVSGDGIERNKVPETGQMYLIDFLFIAVGLIWMAINISKSTRFLFHWVVIAPFAAALTFQSPHALRAENMVIPLVIISAIGFTIILSWFKKYKGYSLIAKWALAVLIAWSFMRYSHMYWVHMAKEYPYSSQYGVKELVDYLEDVEGGYENVVVTTRYDQPYILFLFYKKFSPVKFQEDHFITNRDIFGFSTVSNFDKYIFKEIDWEEDKINFPKSLIIGTPEEILKDTNIVKKIYGSNGYEYFNVVAN